MGKFIDMTGWKMWEHGIPDSRLTVIKRAEDKIMSGHKYIQWLCECNCEQHTHIVILGTQIRTGRTKSCGCVRKEYAAKSCKNFHKTNIYDLTSCSYGVGWTTNTNKEFYFDLEDYDKIKNYCWIECKRIDCKYSCLMARVPDSDNISIKMSYLIFGRYCDHKNRNTFDNRKDNLRNATFAENAQNRSKQSNNKSGVIGVHFNRRKSKWTAQINANKKRKWIGDYSSFHDAVVARLEAELKYYGIDFAPQRYLFEQYKIDTGDTKHV